MKEDKNCITIITSSKKDLYNGIYLTDNSSNDIYYLLKRSINYMNNMGIEISINENMTITDLIYVIVKNGHLISLLFNNKYIVILPYELTKKQILYLDKLASFEKDYKFIIKALNSNDEITEIIDKYKNDIKSFKEYILKK